MKVFIPLLLFHTLCISFSIAQEKIPLSGNMDFTASRISNYASSIRYVTLETSDECLLGGELQIITSAQYIFVHDQIEAKVYRFDLTTGKYLNRIGKRGEGPGEYIRLYGFYVDDSEKKCFLLCNTGIYVYNYEGRFLKKIRIPQGYCPTRMERIGNNYVLNNALYLDTKKELCILDQQGQLIREKELQRSFQIGFMIPSPFFYKLEDRCYYKNDLSETIYLLDDKLNMKPVYLIDCGKKTTNPKENQIDNMGTNLAKEKIAFGRISGYNHKLYIPYFVSNKSFIAIYDMNTKSVITAGQNNESGITDDLTGGPMILPPRNTSLYQSCTPGQLISWFYPSEIDIARYSKGEFGKRLKLLDEESNPIIRIINLK